MRTTIDPSGRLLIPKEIRQQAGLKPGMALDVHCRAGRIEIERAPLAVSVVKKGRLMVAVPRKKTSPLSAETVERTRRAIRRELPA